MMGDAVFQPIVHVLNWIPGSVLIAKVCPPGLESTVFAFLAGISNLGLFGSRLLGSLLMDLFGLQSISHECDSAVEGVCNFTPLPWLVLVCHSILPIVIGVPFALLVLPKTKQTEPVEE
jgi:MFS family permease